MEVPSYDFDLLIENKARKKYTCPICHEIIIYTYKTVCNHRFCKFCITKWKMYFSECPVCRKKLDSVAPHHRTDKWIQQLYDLATPELRQDREMCVNYRKLQQVKMELIGGNHGSAIASKAFSTLSGRTISRTKSGDGMNDKEDYQSLGVQHLYVKNNYTDPDRSPSVTQFSKPFQQNRDSHDVTLLFGTTSPTNLSDGSSRSNYQIRDNSDTDVIQDPLLAEDSFPSGITSAHTYCLHYPKNEGPCLNLSLAELTCHDDLGNKIRDDTIESTCRTGLDIKTTGTGDGNFIGQPKLDFLETKTGTELARSLNVLKAETMCARIQHQIAMAALPNVRAAGSSPSKSSISTGKQTSQREKQDLQSCREALLNLRLRLLPLTKQTSSTLTEKRIKSDAGIASRLKESEFENENVQEQAQDSGKILDVPKIKQHVFPIPKKCQSIQDCKITK
ncbi:unnamed protein product [Allacma fusca]|uniref:RING-type domain-containing protein n=1 Tax=Allacma fusca TaxID=39272 RepID=A0A8J2JIU7_9HEXA|nr:unnamed protein product [Allacma fusca]